MSIFNIHKGVKAVPTYTVPLKPLNKQSTLLQLPKGTVVKGVGFKIMSAEEKNELVKFINQIGEAIRNKKPSSEIWKMFEKSIRNRNL